MRVLITGASGLVGLELQRELHIRGHEVIPMVRSKNKDGVYWNPENLEIDLASMNDADAVIHLAGENISDKRWSEDFKKRIYNSRIQGTSFLARSLGQLKTPPKTFLSASAVGYYGDGKASILSEASPAGHSFLAATCRDWEKSASTIAESIRLCQMRIGVVLSPDGGALAKMLPPFRMGLGGKLGSGQQYFPWIDIFDLVRAIIFLMENDSTKGAFNLSAPHPVTQFEFAKALAKQLNRPCVFHTPAFLLRAAAGEMADELLLASLRCIPQKLLEAGFKFEFPDVEDSLKKISKT